MLTALLGLYVAQAMASIPLSAATALRGSDLLSGRPVEVLLQNPKQATVVLFVSAKCPCSRSHHATLKALADEFPGVQFVGVLSNADEANAGADQQSARDYFRQTGLVFPLLADEGARIANALKAYKTPHAFVFLGDRIVFQGGVDDRANAALATRHYLRSALMDLKAGKEVQQPEVRVLGCEIRRGN